MDSIQIRNFTAFASPLVASCRRSPTLDAGDRLGTLADISAGRRSLDAALATTGLAAVAAEMARAAEDHARHFTHAGRARDDALALFWQVAPSAFADPRTFAAADNDPALTAERMTTAINSGFHARDMAASPLAGQFFNGVVRTMLEVLRARTGSGGSGTRNLASKRR